MGYAVILCQEGPAKMLKNTIFISVYIERISYFKYLFNSAFPNLYEFEDQTFYEKMLIHGTERSPKGRFSCRGMLDFVEDCIFDVVSH